MFSQSQCIYEYDGSFSGFLTCVFESYRRKEIPADIQGPDRQQLSLYPPCDIPTDAQKAARVYQSIGKKVGAAAQSLLQNAFWAGDPKKEMVLYRLIEKGLRLGPKTLDMLGDETVGAAYRLQGAAQGESHLLKGFIRFSQYGDTLVAVIEPKHFALPLLVEHFCTRFCEEKLILFDKSHRLALLYQPYQAQIIPVESLEVPKKSEEESRLQGLWQRYYQSIGIKERFNPRCRMGHMPKRFWAHMTEMEQTNGFLEKEANAALDSPRLTLSDREIPRLLQSAHRLSE